jgi:hypothetical protein
MLKNILLLTYLFIALPTAYGAIYTVSNQVGIERDFSSIQSAIEHAAPYDTIFVKGSPMNYGNVLLEKPLILIGEGFSGDIHPGHTAKLTRILFTSNPYRRTISSGSVVVGFEFPYFPGQRPNIVTVANDHIKIENVTIERNWLWFVDVVGSAENWVFRNNVIRGWVNGGSKGNDMTGAAKFSFQNNIINSILGFKRGDLVVENNVIMGRLKDIAKAQVNNNIFTREGVILDDVFGSKFQNNISLSGIVGSQECYSEPSKFESVYTCSGEANTGSGNITGIDPGFVFWPTNDIMGGTVFKLADGSPARKADRNGIAEAGIYGGKYPFPSAAFLNPEIDDPFPSFVTSIY